MKDRVTLIPSLKKSLSLLNLREEALAKNRLLAAVKKILKMKMTMIVKMRTMMMRMKMTTRYWMKICRIR